MISPVEKNGIYVDSINIFHVNNEKGWYFNAGERGLKYENLDAYANRGIKEMMKVPEPERDVFAHYFLYNAIVDSQKSITIGAHSGVSYDFNSCEYIHRDKMKILENFNVDNYLLSNLIIPYILELFLKNIHMDNTDLINTILDRLKPRANNLSELNTFKEGMFQLHQSYKNGSKKNLDVGLIGFFGPSSAKIEKREFIDSFCFNAADRFTRLLLSNGHFTKEKKRRKIEKSLSSIQQLDNSNAIERQNNSQENGEQNQKEEKEQQEEQEGQEVQGLSQNISYAEDLAFMEALDKLYLERKQGFLEDNPDYDGNIYGKYILEIIHRFEKQKLVQVLDQTVNHKLKITGSYIFQFEWEILKQLNDSTEVTIAYKDFLKGAFNLDTKFSNKFVRKRLKYLKGIQGNFIIKDNLADQCTDLVFTTTNNLFLRKILYPLNQLEQLLKIFEDKIEDVSAFNEFSDRSSADQKILVCNLTKELFQFYREYCNASVMPISNGI